MYRSDLVDRFQFNDDSTRNKNVDPVPAFKPYTFVDSRALVSGVRGRYRAK
ncbi:MAG TPA: hypothetical protein VMH89_03355 [Candidatus Acidoferrum sp.]|nr:hypothetical protein [Candidatus Acidoferrum sp.]